MLCLFVFGELTVAEPCRLRAVGYAELCGFLRDDVLLKVDMRTGAIETKRAPRRLAARAVAREAVAHPIKTSSADSRMTVAAEWS